ncbi:hypothetical protein C3492_41435 [Streptomyces sp. Ru62]|uniref:hypothetical protein n=1 Tax=Streptomyces sp. Ru62 TaxID=2080745 RepID=UPI000CDE4052|nr:hypothetical protein [Streptomyces sp. Ru62]POX57802.1 hypothetical protein C3492_41435 [Streptomyces sp. Ru62]
MTTAATNAVLPTATAPATAPSPGRHRPVSSTGTTIPGTTAATPGTTAATPGTTVTTPGTTAATVTAAAPDDR